MIRRLGIDDVEFFYDMLDLFAAAFEDPEHYGARRPDSPHVKRLLASPTFVALVALAEGRVVGALVAYELPKFEQTRSEFFLYDLAVDARHRRRGIASALIEALQDIARQKDAAGIYVQAHHDDEGAISLYARFGPRANVFHFDFSF
jgi:ribosomal protein S18 acetylase RimI-like enzyme